MAKHADVVFTGKSGNTYTFGAYPWGTAFKAIGAVYFITKRSVNPNGSGSHTRIYVGQTENLSERFDDHRKIDCFALHSADCICVYVESSKPTRLAIENDLLLNYSPPCNG